ncbi:MAG: peptide deformylase [Verrucomicrobia bacterium]|nr:peptide deformylase [Verrucomicrobiota bacterium]NBU08434.1 peptide deformylase [Pseudomonadota bacterium]NDB76434.1 peptide deformylase [Verrucomicrobiota bacterium]
MKLPVHKYGDPVLRKKGAPVTKVTPEILQLIADMFETMEANHGVGLAAQQVGHALQLTVIDIRPIEDRPSTLELDGKPADPKSIMPLVLLNPVVKPVGEIVAGSEGCLSFPKLYGEIERPESVDVTATNEKGEPLSFRCGGLLARCVQHETDHLNGILFIDRMSRTDKEDLKADLEDLQAATKAALKKAKK